MKTIFLSLFSLFFFDSCSPTKGNKTEIFKTYNHPDYTFKYPKNWRIIGDPLVVDDPSVYVAPFKETNDNTSMTFGDKTKAGIYSSTYFCIYKDSIVGSFEEFINNKIKKITESDHYHKLLEKSENHYLLYYDTNTFKSDITKKQFFKIHYYYLHPNVYSIMFISAADTYYLYEKDQQLIENSFLFKNTGTRLIQESKP